MKKIAQRGLAVILVGLLTARSHGLTVPQVTARSQNPAASIADSQALASALLSARISFAKVPRSQLFRGAARFVHTHRTMAPSWQEFAFALAPLFLALTYAPASHPFLWAITGMGISFFGESSAAIELYRSDDSLNTYLPRKLRDTLVFIRQRRDARNPEVSVHELMQVFVEEGRLPGDAEPDFWLRAADAYDFYLAHPRIESYKRPELRSTLQIASRHLYQFPGVSFSKLAVALAIGGKDFKWGTLLSTERNAAAFAFYWKSEALQAYRPTNVNETLRWLHLNWKAFDFRSFSFLVSVFDVMGKIPEQNDGKVWRSHAVAYELALKFQPAIEEEILRVQEANGPGLTFEHLRAQWDRSKLLNRAGRPLADASLVDMTLLYAWFLYGKRLVSIPEKIPRAAPSALHEAA